MISDCQGPVGTSKPQSGGDVSRAGVSLQKPFESYHQHKESVSTSASTSADSSPTTTASIVDDSSATEMSPGSSPESPLGKPYPTSFGMTHTRPHTSDNAMMHSSQPFFELQRSTTPGKKGRNLKNLAVNTSGAFVMSRAASTTSLPMSTSLQGTSNSESVGQSFSKPPSLTKRRSSKNLGLTILTPANSKALPHQSRAAVPPTPSFTRPNTLRHFQSSPSLPLHITEEIREEPSSEANQGQKEFTLPIIPRAHALKTNDSDQNFDVPQSKEEKPEAYPDGPICVYGNYMDLYLEPTAEQASRYDVILNVASEVRNPFDIATFQPSGPELRFDGGGGIQYAPKRSYLTASNSLGRENLSPVYESSPTTPKANPFQTEITSAPQPKKSTKPEPEYIHIPWEHNTDIVPDLHRLVKVIDERIQQGKRVLIHCQCGVSRSATLVVAYVIYKNPTMSVQEAYDAVKKRSKWIGPNMNLIMQLQEFRSTLQRPLSRFGNSRGLSPNTPPLGFIERGRPASYDGGAAGIKSPKTAPLPPESGAQSHLLSPTLTAVSPGPSSAPSGLTWPSDHDEPAPKRSEESTRQEAAYVDPNGRVVPVVQIVEDHPILEPKTSKEPKDRPRSLNLESHIRQDSGRHITPMLSPRSTEFGMATLRPSKEMDSADQFGLLSPRASEFSQSPFDRDSLLGALGMGTAMPQPPRPQRLSPDVPKPSSEKRVPKSLTLRPKISAPSLSEQRELQDMQSRIEAKLTHEEPDFLEALASPRAFEFTQNPFANLPGESTETEKPAAGVKRDEDPRSPPHQGAYPITRNIFDVL